MQQLMINVGQDGNNETMKATGKGDLMVEQKNTGISWNCWCKVFFDQCWETDREKTS